MIQLDLKNKLAFVGGSTQGIGKAAALELAARGANVVLIARNEPRLLTSRESLDTSQGQTHAYIIADHSEPEQVQERVLQYCQQEKLKEAHILINNSGGPAPGAIFDADPDDFRMAYEQHLIVNQLLVQTLTPLMKQAQYGRIINIISTSVKEPIAGLGVSNTTRWAVAAWAKTLAQELAPFGITVNNILPGFIKTGRLDSLIENRAQKAGVSREEMEQQLISMVPAGRLGETNEIGAAIAFLASPAASYINGINLPVDGGKTRNL
ncbi:MAG: SDR family oxidoreductase [Bacteroidota bacterium]